MCQEMKTESSQQQAREGVPMFLGSLQKDFLPAYGLHLTRAGDQ